ncbi:GINS complex subunit [Pseudogymnoascus australis]
MDIDDILREADPEYYSKPGDDGDLEALTRAWVSERSAPELLDWPSNGLIERANEKIQRQIEKVEVMTGDMDPKTNFGLIVIQTELERWKYLVRGFLRARLAKIDKHTLHYLSSPSLRSRLSPAEISFATRHQALLHEHYLSSFLQSFPPQLRNLDDTAGGISMVDAPELDTAVFIRALKDCLVETQGGNAEDMVEALAGEVLIARWADVKPLVLRGDAELV